MYKKRILFLFITLVLAFTILAGQIAGVAYAGNGNHGNKHTDDHKTENNLQKQLKPLLNVKVKNGDIIVTNRLVNPNGRKTEVDITGIWYEISIKPFYNTNSGKLWKFNKTKISFDSYNLKPGRIKELEYEDILHTNTGLWNSNNKQTGNGILPGKYIAEVKWTVEGRNNVKYTISAAKVFVINQKHLDFPKPNQPQIPAEKPNVYVDLKTTKEDGRLRIDFALVNESTQKVSYEFNNGQQYDIVITKDGREVYRWSRGKFFTMALTKVDIAAEGKYQFPAVYWDYIDKNNKKVLPDKYTVKVEVMPNNKSTLEKSFDLSTHDYEEISVGNDDVNFDIDVVIQTEVVDRQLKWNLILRNRSGQNAVIWHRNGQKHKITIRDKMGNIVYTSDEDIDYTTALTETKLPAGIKENFAGGSLNLLSMDLEPGVYNVEADLNVSYVKNSTGSRLKNYYPKASKRIKLTEFDVNKNVAVMVNPKVAYGKLYIPISLTNVSGKDLSIFFGSRTDYTVLIKKNDKVVFEYSENLYSRNKTFALKNKDTIKIDEVSWDMKSGRKQVSGDISILVTLKGDVYRTANRTADWQTVQVFTLP